jgi:hypothetical protein
MKSLYPALSEHCSSEVLSKCSMVDKDIGRRCSACYAVEVASEQSIKGPRLVVD